MRARVEMDSTALLDYALFMLTPTRTRCDLVIFASGLKEKLASGLLEPFVSQLRCAKEQISKGGYSITLQPPSSVPSPWFTKATLQRFVRFVSTPEVLERFVTIEIEIEQIDRSVQPNDLSYNMASSESEGNISASNGNSKKSTASSKARIESNGIGDAASEENSKACLQRALETRKLVLRKEQAMAYARALVVGFETDCIDDLINFSETFGASRLREACINFIGLCKKKKNDSLWMDELAAMQSCSRSELSFLGTSGIILAGEENDRAQNMMIDLQNGLSGGKQNPIMDTSVSDSTASHGSVEISQDEKTQVPQVPMSWPHHFAQYMNNFQGPPFQQMPPSPYVFPGMNVGHQYFPRNMQRPPSREDSVFDQGPTDRRRHRSLSRKEEKSSQDAITDSNDSSSGSDSDEYSPQRERPSLKDQMRRRNHGKKSSRKVVIRNINYITSRRDGDEGGTSEDNSFSEDGLINGESLKQHVQEVVGSLERHQKTTHHKRQHGSKQSHNVSGSTGDDGNIVAKNDSWDAFQNLLMKDRDSDSNTESQSIQFKEEIFTAKSFPGAMQRAVPSDTFLLNDRDNCNENNHPPREKFYPDEDTHPIIKREDNTVEELFFSHRNEELGNYSKDIVSDHANECSRIKSRAVGDCVVDDRPDVSQDEGLNLNTFEQDYASSLAGDGYKNTVERKKDVFVDDSFMVNALSVPNEEDDNSQLRTDISMITGIVGASQLENSKIDIPQGKSFGAKEPNDLCMVLDRNDVAGSSVAWTPEMVFGNEISERPSDVAAIQCVDSNSASNDKATGKNGRAFIGKGSSKEPKPKSLGGSLRKTKSDIIYRSHKPSPGRKMMDLKSKSEKEEENRRMKEELALQRQKRIAERSAASGSFKATSKKTPLGNTTAVTSKSAKTTISSLTPEMKKVTRSVMKSSTIDRLATGRRHTDEPSKSNQPKKATLKANGVTGTAEPEKAYGVYNKIQSTKKVKLSDQRGGPKDSNNVLSSASDRRKKVSTDVTPPAVPMNPSLAQATQIPKGKDYSNSIKMDCVTSVERDAGELNSKIDHMDDKISNGNLRTVPTENGYLEPSYSKGDDGGKSEASDILCEDKKTSNDIRVAEDPIPVLATDALNINREDQSVAKPISPEISEIEMSTPPPSNGVSPDLEATHLRKKWNNGEGTPKAAKGFRKLLLFGRKSHNIAAS